MTTNPIKDYRPDLTIHPGESLQEAIVFANISQKELSLRTGITEKHMSNILNGFAPITPDFAIKLERALGISASFWNNLQKKYDQTVAYQKSKERLECEVSWLSDFVCYKDLVALKFVENVKSKTEKVEQLLNFFAVDSLFQLDALNAKFRTSKSKQVNVKSIYAWLRCGELMSKNINVSEFSEAKIKTNLSQIRALTLEPPNSQKIESFFSNLGIAIVLVPYFSKSSICGAFRWIGDKPVVQLNVKGAFVDRFWFTLFHELGHVLLHGKKGKYVDIDFNDHNEEEIQANKFAADTLIPAVAYEPFVDKKIFTDSEIERFAQSVGIGTAIVKGRLAFEKYVAWSDISHSMPRVKIVV